MLGCHFQIFALFILVNFVVGRDIIPSKKQPISDKTKESKELLSSYPLPNSEMNALRDLYDFTQGPNWIYRTGSTHWNFTSSTANPCTEHWQGVTCLSIPPYNHVRRLVMLAMNLVGTLPNTLPALEHLSSLSFAVNVLNGTIPPSFGNLSALTYLDVGLNGLTGTVPASFVNLKHIEYLDFSVNALTGTIPSFFGKLTQLLLIDIGGNEMSGTIPCALAQIANLQGLHLFDNLLTGTVPECICNYSSLSLMDIGSNQLSGTLPASIGNMLLIRSLYLYDNALTGSLPVSFSKLSQLVNLEAYDNLLTGNIPESYGNITLLNVLAVYNNRLTGTLPETLGRLALLKYFYLNSNYISGVLPSSLSNLTNLALVDVHENNLSGDVPAFLGNNSQLQFLVLYGNHFSGTLPLTLSNLTNLIELQVQNNYLSGPLEGRFNHSNQINLAIVQLDDNQFTGELPEEIFLLPSLTTVVAVSNCLRGQLPLTVCNSTSLITLVLDGISSARVCRSSLLPQISTSYFTDFELRGTVPACLLELPLLNTLHLSGNGLTGSLPAIKVSESLIDLSLSHNLLTGTIPPFIQQRRWVRLDLSYNRLTGTLIPDFATVEANYSSEVNVYEKETSANNSVSPTLLLEDNRLSGRVPQSVKSYLNISVLSANVFACHLDKSDLPRHDTAKDNYQCGSDSFDTPYYIWLGLIAVVLMVLLYAVAYPGQSESMWKALGLRVRVWLHATTLNIETRSYFRRLHLLAQVMLCCAAWILLALLPLYIALNHYHGTVVHSYAWQASAAYLSGTTAVAFEFPVFVVVAIVCVVAFVHCFPIANSSVDSADNNQVTQHISNKDNNNNNNNNNNSSSNGSNYQRKGNSFIASIWFILVNVFVVVGVNAAFVYVAIYRSSTLLIVSQILISLFKIAWNNYCTALVLRVTVRALVSEEAVGRIDIDYGALQIFAALLNNIVIPCLVVVAISPDCFFQIFDAAPTITSLFSYPSCVLDDNFDCILTVPKVSSTAYDPPFRYSYQCSSSLITFYAPAYVFLCLVLTFAAPLMQSLAVLVHQNTASETRIHSLVDKMLPSSLRPLTAPVANQQLSSTTQSATSVYVQPPALAANVETRTETRKETLTETAVFVPAVGANRAMIVVWTFLGLLLTFGVVFPPLAAAIAVTLLVTVAGVQLRTGRLLIAAVRLGRADVVAAVEVECAASGKVSVLHYSMWMIVTASCWFYTLFLFDTLGNAVGFESAYWVLIAMPLLPLVLYCTVNLVRAVRRADKQKQEFRGDRAASVIEMQPVSAKGARTEIADLEVHISENGGVLAVAEGKEKREEGVDAVYNALRM